MRFRKLAPHCNAHAQPAIVLRRRSRGVAAAVAAPAGRVARRRVYQSIVLLDCEHGLVLRRALHDGLAGHAVVRRVRLQLEGGDAGRGARCGRLRALRGHGSGAAG